MTLSSGKLAKKMIKSKAFFLKLKKSISRQTIINYFKPKLNFIL